MSEALEFKDVEIWLEQRMLIDNFSFSLPEGGITAVVGPNGVGKSTLLRTLVGFDGAKYRGNIKLFNSNLIKLTRNERAKLIGYMPQGASFNFPYTVLEFMEMSFYPYGFQAGSDANRRSQIISALKELEIEHLGNQGLMTLSGGECQRVFFAAAVVHKPKILLLDEPTASLDPLHEGLFEAVVRTALRDKKISVLLVTHALNLVSSLADQVVALKAGSVAYCGQVQGFFSESVIESVYGVKSLIIEHPKRKISVVIPA